MKIRCPECRQDVAVVDGRAEQHTHVISDTRGSRAVVCHLSGWDASSVLHDLLRANERLTKRAMRTIEDAEQSLRRLVNELAAARAAVAKLADERETATEQLATLAAQRKDAS